MVVAPIFVAGGLVLLSGNTLAQAQASLPSASTRVGTSGSGGFLSVPLSDVNGVAGATDSLHSIDALVQQMAALSNIGSGRVNTFGPISGNNVTYDYQGGGKPNIPTSGNFSGTNFSPSLGAMADTTPVSTSTDTLVFNGNSSYTATDDFTSVVNLGILTLGSTGSAVVTLATGTGSVSNTLSFSNGKSDAINLNNVTAASIALNLTLSGPTTVSGSGSATLSGVISGGVSLTQAGTGILTLTGTNTYTGGTTINAGSLNVGVSGGTATTASLGTGNVTVNMNTSNGGGGYLVFYAASSAGSSTITNNYATYFYNTSTAGSSTINNNGGLLFSESSTAGSSTINNNVGATLEFQSAATANNATITNLGTLDLSGSYFTNGMGLSIGSLSGAGGVRLSSQALTVDGLASNPSTTISGVIQDGGSGSLIKAGTGTLTLTGANTYTGNTTISAGTLTLGNSLALQNSTLVYNTGGGTLSFGTLTSATFAGLTGNLNLTLANASAAAVTLTLGNNDGASQYDGVLRGGGSLIKTGSGTLILTGASTFTGGTTISEGTVAATGKALSVGAVTVMSGATLSVGEAPNGTLSPTATSILSVNSLAVTTGSTPPLLTFNLGIRGTSDMLNLNGSGNELTFSGSGTFDIGFASATGSSLGSGTYTLINFATPESPTAAPLLTQYTASPTGNLARINGGSFAYRTNSGGSITGLNFTIGGSADALPEPNSVGLVLAFGLPGLGALALRRRAACRADSNRAAHPYPRRANAARSRRDKMPYQA